jgi:hypothetical protein
MDYSKPGFWIAIGIGGLLVAILSGGQQYYSNQPDQPFTFRPVFRDFCLGASVTATIYMFLPDSIDSWISAGKDTLTSMTGGASTSTPSTSSIELQTGPARF